MTGRTKRWIATLSAVGIIALGGAVYTTTALAGGGPGWMGLAGGTAAPALGTAAQSQTAQAPDQAQIRAAVLDMIKDRMGITGAEAETLADQMIARMQTAGISGTDLQNMLQWCTSNAAPGGTAGGRMMRGAGAGTGTGYGMMRGTPRAGTAGGYCGGR
jgi:hypothetical protein